MDPSKLTFVVDADNVVDVFLGDICITDLLKTDPEFFHIIHGETSSTLSVSLALECTNIKIIRKSKEEVDR